MKINRQAVHDKYSGHCAYCGKIITIKEMQVDHIVNSQLLPDEFEQSWNKMKASIIDPDEKKWFDSVSGSILNDEAELLKSNNRLRMQKIRASLAGLKSVDGGKA